MSRTDRFRRPNASVGEAILAFQAGDRDTALAMARTLPEDDRARFLVEARRVDMAWIGTRSAMRLRRREKARAARMERVKAAARAEALMPPDCVEVVVLPPEAEATPRLVVKARDRAFVWEDEISDDGEAAWSRSFYR